ncbi:pyridoxamine 5'-phosphate oxidase [Solitalea lacus]|uniref:pyridoxamine 5'-phosphate oxidase n=1 Tax=Solitalea lacus TaxID=2911172 RepID=UPI001ED9F2D8|nr:pyridoxamine 5'-phosphate oxidase [Solitalea lacus]UKJ06255.1 pyridoxamine 5'-phosphate oxidase [Solitalea lacus]
MNLEKTTLENLRQEYSARSLSEKDVNSDPFRQFELWFNEAMQSGILEPNALTLSTATSLGKPSARVVLLKGFSDEGFTFFTNYNSRKGHELRQNPFACISFFWLELQRQIIIEGVIEKVSLDESTRYYQTRPKGSQLGAWVSEQSTVIADREVLENKLAELENQYANQEVLPKPEYWGGYLLKPSSIEFWQGRPSRLHDRIQYILEADGNWKIQRLAP